MIILAKFEVLIMNTSQIIQDAQSAANELILHFMDRMDAGEFQRFMNLNMYSEEEVFLAFLDALINSCQDELDRLDAEDEVF